MTIPEHTHTPIRPRGRWLTRLCADYHAWLLILLILPALLPLAAPGYFFKAHDARHSVYFLVEFDQAFRDGAPWPVWTADQAVGFGYPLWLLYAPLAYFAAEAFHLLGLGFTAAVKATWALGFVLGALGAYRLGKRWWGPAAGLVAGLAFTYAPYRLVQIYVRGDLSEFMALAWLPWALLALAALWDDPGPRRAAGAGLAFGALLMINTVTTLIFAALVAAFLGWLLARDLRAARRKTAPFRPAALGWTLAALGLGGLLTSIFMIPMLLERSYIVEAQWVHATYDYSQHFVYFSQFFDPRWGFGYSVPGPNDDMSFALGPIIFLAAAVGGLAALGRGDRLPHRAEALFLTILSVAAIIGMTPLAAPLWQALPLINLVQFPWRLLAVVALALALLAGAAAWWLGHRGEPAHDTGPGPYPYVLALALILASLPYTQPQLQPVRPEDESPLAVIQFELDFPDMRGMTRWSERVPTNADSPLIDQYQAGAPLRRAAIARGQGTILEQSATPLSARARVQADGPVHLRFFTYYFPGWRAEVDGRPAEIAPDPPNGLIGLDLPPGEHDVRIRFGATPVRRGAAALSLVGLALVVGLWIYGRRRGA